MWSCFLRLPVFSPYRRSMLQYLIYRKIYACHFGQCSAVVRDSADSDRESMLVGRVLQRGRRRHRPAKPEGRARRRIRAVLRRTYDAEKLSNKPPCGTVVPQPPIGPRGALRPCCAVGAHRLPQRSVVVRAQGCGSVGRLPARLHSRQPGIGRELGLLAPNGPCPVFARQPGVFEGRSENEPREKDRARRDRGRARCARRRTARPSRCG